jgi:hypothetical protein
VAHNIYMYCQFKMKVYIKVRRIIVTCTCNLHNWPNSLPFMSHDTRTLKTPWKERNKQENENFAYFILIILLSSVLNLNVPDEGYSRNAMRITFDIYISITNTGYYLLKLKVLGVCGKKVKVPKHDNQNRLRLPIF